MKLIINNIKGRIYLLQQTVAIEMEEERKLYRNKEVKLIYSENGRQIGLARFHCLFPMMGPLQDFSLSAYWCGYVYNDLIDCSAYYSYAHGDFPHTSMACTGATSYQNRPAVGFDHGHFADNEMYTNLTGVINEVRWLYNEFGKEAQSQE
jgi:hypothetical protein